MLMTTVSVNDQVTFMTLRLLEVDVWPFDHQTYFGHSWMDGNKQGHRYWSLIQQKLMLQKDNLQAFECFSWVKE